jgi:hypothetical protein
MEKKKKSGMPHARNEKDNTQPDFMSGSIAPKRGCQARQPIAMYWPGSYIYSGLQRICGQSHIEIASRNSAGDQRLPQARGFWLWIVINNPLQAIIAAVSSVLHFAAAGSGFASTAVLVETIQ